MAAEEQIKEGSQELDEVDKLENQLIQDEISKMLLSRISSNKRGTIMGRLSLALNK